MLISSFIASPTIAIGIALAGNLVWACYCFVILLYRLTQSSCLLLFYSNIMNNENEDSDEDQNVHFGNGNGVQEQRQRLQPAREEPYNERNAFDVANLRPLVSAGMVARAQALISMVMTNGGSVVGLEELAEEEYSGRFRIMVLQILRIQKSSKQAQANMTRRKNGGNVTPVNYDRVVYAMDIFGRAGHNTCVILLGGGSNDLFWKFDVSMRDGLTTNSKAFFAFILSCHVYAFSPRVANTISHPLFKMSQDQAHCFLLLCQRGSRTTLRDSPHSMSREVSSPLSIT